MRAFYRRSARTGPQRIVLAPADGRGSGIGDRGWGILALSENQKKRRNEGSERIGEPAEKPAKRDIGHALRSVYARTVNEEIPSELLDLLGKLD